MRSIALLLLCFSFLSATPLYYDFYGVASNPNYTNSDKGGFLAANGITDYTVVRYVYLVDFEALGRHEFYAGNAWEKDRVTPTSTTDLFYTEMVGGGLIEGVTLTPPAGDEWTWITGYNAGSFYESKNYSVLEGGSTSNMYWVTDKNAGWGSPLDWEVGMSNFTGFERAFNENGQASVIYSGLTLGGIYEYNPLSTPPQSVPEASTFSLLFAGLCMLPILKFRKNKNI